MGDNDTGEVGNSRFVIVSEIATSDLKEEEFSDKVVDDADVFSVSELDTAGLLSTCKSVHRDLTLNTVTSTTASNIVLLAHHLKTPDNKDLLFKRLKTWVPVLDAEIKLSTPDETPAVQDMDHSSSQEESLIGADVFDTSSVVQEGSVIDDHTPPTNPFIPKDVLENPEDLITFMCFTAAYSMRLLTKQSANMEKSWPHMVTKFIGSYRTLNPVNAKITLAAWSSLKTYLCATRKYQITWISLIAKTEDAVVSNSDEHGLVRYIGILVFSYSGMHAYSLFCNLVKITHTKYDFLLNQMDCPKTSDTCTQIFKVLTRYGLKSSTEKPYFKYARLFGAQYFMSLQTKASPLFIYLVVCILKDFTSHSSEQDPSNIVGLDTISSRNKTYLVAMARSISSLIEAGDKNVKNPHCRVAAAAVEGFSDDQNKIGATSLFS